MAVKDYTTSSLIAYLGNKRSLLPFLRRVFLELHEREPVERFLDPFAGTGAVSRLARTLGWRVAANDIEPYALAVNACHLGVSADDIPALFEAESGIDNVLELLNSLHPQREDRIAPGPPAWPYIAEHYAPALTDSADWRRERLFYTRENAIFLDRAREAIEALRPSPGGASSDRGPRERSEKERALLLGPLVYEAATHANTSGVFKACHKGFGGHGRDALGRILAPMRLERPVLWPGPAAELARMDAAAFCGGRAADLCYLDPPYNQHQYGSNYHLLNTLVVWDRLPVDDSRRPDGSLRAKAGIPDSWKERRSRFCSRRGAGAAFAELLAEVDARFVVLSYNSEGIVPPEELFDLLSDRAEVSLRSVNYVTYRGGRQSADRKTGNSEIVFVARRREGRARDGAARLGHRLDESRLGPPGGSEPRLGIGELGRMRAETRLSRVLSGPFEPRRLAPLVSEEWRIRVNLPSGPLEIPTYHGLLVEPADRAIVDGLDVDEMEALADRLEPAIVRDNGEACEACARLLEEGLRDRRIQDLALLWLRKLAHRKYAEAFRSMSARLYRCVEADPVRLIRMRGRLSRLEELFSARLAGQSGRGSAQSVDG